MTASLSLSPAISPFPYAATAIAEYLGKTPIVYDSGATTLTFEFNGNTISDEAQIVHALAQDGALSSDPVKTSAYFALAKSLQTLTAFPEIVAAFDSLDDHLTLRTFLVGHSISAADWIVWGAIKGSVKLIGLLKNNSHPHVLRWFSHIESLDSTQAVLSGLAEAKANKARSNKVAASFELGLPNAKMGEVVTRFPPEPSGYLHIGHAKAAVLNQYFAKMYNGKLLIRFDDTNPSNESSEFEDTILEDLHLLDVRGDTVTHTSDHFDILYTLAVKMIETGKAYADDTEKAQMSKERWDGIASKNRDNSIEENLKHFAEMKEGSPEGVRWCIRAKMSVDNLNKALRDPVIYRCNLTPHHRTGDKWKIYPTYDFACPVVDSIEGVTHALRTNEYRDRNPQYQWMIEALSLRKVDIWDFSRLNFIYTLLSKRKLRWFVEQKLVRGWDDPRFPTVRGIRRRGLTVQALQQFMLSQGPSSSVVSLEWDSIWATNKKVVDPIAPRFWAITKKNHVLVKLTNGPTEPETKTLPKHKKNAEIGDKTTVYTSNILLEQEDALSFGEQEEITLMDWGNAIVRSKSVDGAGVVTSIQMELHLEGDFRKTKKKITWLSNPTATHPLVEVTLLDYDYLITKKKLDDDDDMSSSSIPDFVTPVTEFAEAAVADANVLSLSTGAIIQFERKGYYILDNIVGGESKTYEFIHIPDGRAASLASKAMTTGGGAPAKDMSVPVSNRMYQVDSIYGDALDALKPKGKMYTLESIYLS